MADVIKYRFRCRRRTAAQWTAINEILLDSEIGLEDDTGLGKIGDGVTAWNNLFYTIVGRVDLTGIADGSGLVWDAVNSKWKIGAAGGQVNTIVAGTNVDIDSTDPVNPVVSSLAGFFAVKGRKADYAGLPASGNAAGDAYLLDSDGLVYIWNGTAWPAEGDGEAVSGLQAQPPSSYPVAGDKSYPTHAATFLNAIIGGVAYLLPAFVMQSSLIDPYLADVISLLNFSGADGSTVFTDAKGATWTGTGNAQIDTSLGYNTLLLDGAGDYISTPKTADWDWFNQDFTMEAWVNPVDLSTWSYMDGTPYTVMLGYRDPAGLTSVWGFGPRADGALQFRYFAGSTYQINTTAGDVVNNVLTHVEMSKVSNTIYLFVNGVLKASAARQGSLTASATGIIIGQGNNRSLNGCIQAVRITKGVGRHTSGFTPPPAPFPSA